MPVEKRSGRSSPDDILERVFEGGIIIDPSDRLSVTPEESVLETLCAELQAIIVRCALEQARQEATGH